MEKSYHCINVVTVRLLFHYRHYPACSLGEDREEFLCTCKLILLLIVALKDLLTKIFAWIGQQSSLKKTFFLSVSIADRTLFGQSARGLNFNVDSGRSPLL
jgi:hypothetical protein